VPSDQGGQVGFQMKADVALRPGRKQWAAIDPEQSLSPIR
jgi:hypothetical protein